MISKTFSKLFNIKNTFAKPTASFAFQKRKGDSTFVQPQSSNRRNNQRADEDVHFRRYTELSKEGDNVFTNISDGFRFTFDTIHNTNFVDLDDINIINIENKDTFYRTP